MESLDATPKVDASLQSLAGHIIVPLKEMVSFEDCMERMADSELKKFFTTAGAACRPAVALTSIARVIKDWSSSLDFALSYCLQGLKLSAEFIAEAAG